MMPWELDSRVANTKDRMYSIYLYKLQPNLDYGSGKIGIGELPGKPSIQGTFGSCRSAGASQPN